MGENMCKRAPYSPHLAKTLCSCCSLHHEQARFPVYNLATCCGPQGYLQANLPVEKPAGDHVAMRVEGKLQNLLRKLNGLHGFRFLVVSVHPSRGVAGCMTLIFGFW